MSCPSDHVLKDNMCTIAPTMSCPSGYTLVNGMCQPDEVAGYGDSMNIPPTQNGIISQTIMSEPTSQTHMMMSPKPWSPAPPPQAAAASNTRGSPVSPMIDTNNCPSGYSFNRSDNMCYPL
jgi:hypothetical protein